MLTPYEIARIIAGPVLPVMHVRARRSLLALCRKANGRGRRLQLLDVGGRRSPYTIGLPCDIVVSDLPRTGGVQQALGLGMTHEIVALVRRRRSNVRAVVFDDMTTSAFASQSFDGVACVEVIEHVREDDRFVLEIARVLRVGGFAYFTTPNGDYVRNSNPDHIRHYTRAQLVSLLEHKFARVDVNYAVRISKAHAYGIHSFTFRRPLRTLAAMAGNLVNHWQSRGIRVAESPRGTQHLVAVAWKLARD